MASALFGSTAIGYGDLFDRKVDDNGSYSRIFKVVPSIVICCIVNILSMSGGISLRTPMHEKM